MTKERIPRKKAIIGFAIFALLFRLYLDLDLLFIEESALSRGTEL